nr:TIGR00730 family Rossman fold protein [Telmatospirillum sp. J64-1]
MTRLRSLCVFCGASTGSDPAHLQAARRLGSAMAARNIRLVYGGGHVGLMGTVADAVLDGGGEVVGIIPEHLVRAEAAYREITELLVVDSMHTRKRAMFDRSDAFCVLPGGLGTMDETFEILTWKQLRLHDKPVILVNQNGYFDPLLGLIDSIIAQGFAHSDVARLYEVVADAEDVLDVAAAGLAASDSGRF